MSNYFDTYIKKDCNGCGVCSLKCPKRAITMSEDSEGFLYPIIDETKCIHCNLCKKICPNKDYPDNDNVTSYIAINKNKDDLKNSSSGGCFLPIAKYILSKKGVVFGVIYDENLNVKHTYFENEKDLIKFQGSKYVRSDLNDSFKKVKDFLNNDRYVLFSGTPCQCQGLRTYLGKDFDKLYTCEIICHANPSKKIFEYYKKHFESIKGKKITDIKFRTKSNGWRNQMSVIIFSDGEEIEDNVFYLGFVNELFNRPSCHNCHFCSSNRLSDFTIGDAWGIELIDKTIVDDDTGISLLCVNTNKGKKLINYFNDNMLLKKVDTNKAFSHNHYKNVPMHKNRDKFYSEISNGTINENNILDYISKYTKVSFLKKVVNKLKSIFFKLLKLFSN